MEANEYQRLASRTLLDRPDHMPTEEQYMILWNVLGLAGEAGEVANLVKKGICHQHGLDRDKVIDELSDVAWYLAAICSKLGISLSDVMQANIDKLSKRYGVEGYTSAQSINRTDDLPDGEE